MGPVTSWEYYTRLSNSEGGNPNLDNRDKWKTPGRNPASRHVRTKEAQPVTALISDRHADWLLPAQWTWKPTDAMATGPHRQAPYSREGREESPQLMQEKHTGGCA